MPYRFDHSCDDCGKKRPVRIIGSRNLCAKCAKKAGAQDGKGVTEMATTERPVFKNGRGEDVFCPELDEGLLLAANRLATGANVHDVNEAKSYYINTTQYAQARPSAYNYIRAHEYRRSLQSLLIKIERMATGKAG